MKYRKEIELGPDAIQKWCEELYRKKKCEMSEEDTELFIKIKLREGKINNDAYYEKMLAMTVMYRRIKQFHTFTASNAVLMFMGCMIDRPGIAVEYCNYMQYKCWQHGIKHIDMEAFGKHIFPMGFFDEETLHEMWEKQKIVSKDGKGLGNMLDHPEFMESIREIKER